MTFYANLSIVFFFYNPAYKQILILILNINENIDSALAEVVTIFFNLSYMPAMHKGKVSKALVTASRVLIF